MPDRGRDQAPWKATWEDSRRALLESLLTSAPSQRLAWLEEALEIARRSGALAARRGQDR